MHMPHITYVIPASEPMTLLGKYLAHVYLVSFIVMYWTDDFVNYCICDLHHIAFSWADPHWSWSSKWRYSQISGAGGQMGFGLHRRWQDRVFRLLQTGTFIASALLESFSCVDMCWHPCIIQLPQLQLIAERTAAITCTQIIQVLIYWWFQSQAAHCAALHF